MYNFLVISLANEKMENKKRSKFKESSEIHRGEIVYTKSSQCVLDIGWVESLYPLKILAPYSVYECKKAGYKRYYGNPSGCHWYGTNLYKNIAEWEVISKGKYEQEICYKLGIPYWEKR